MLNFNNIIQKNPYSLEKKIKYKLFKNFFTRLNYHHYKNCKKYKKIIDNFKFKLKNKKNKLEAFPMLPVKVFKSFELISVNKNKIVKKLISSGTSGQNLSKIYLDKNNVNN